MTSGPPEAAPSRAASGAWTIGRVLTWAASDFAKRGLDSPRLDAELLLGHVLGVDRIQLIVQAEQELEPPVLERYRGLIARRRNAEPIAYLLGRREFYGLDLRVDRRVLVPRPDTETLVEVALKRTQAQNLYGRAWDVCTGSGCVAIAFAKARPTWHVLATDVSTSALEVAALNVQEAGASWNVVCRAGDLFEALPVEALPVDPGFDLMTANPPYISSAETERLPADIRRHEPRLALDGGVDGLEVVARIVAGAPNCLRDGGVLALEVGAGQAGSVSELLLRCGFRDIERCRDYGGWERVVSAVWFSA